MDHENSVGSVGQSDVIIAKMDILKYNAGCVIILSIMSQQELDKVEAIDFNL